MEGILPPTDLSQIEKLPRDLQSKTLLDLDYKDIINTCNTSKTLNYICNDVYFWKAKFNHDIRKPINIPEDILSNIDKNKTIKWYKYRIQQYPLCQDLLNLINNERIIGVETTDSILGTNWNDFDIINNITKINVSNMELTMLPDMLNVINLNCSHNELISLPNIPNIISLRCGQNYLSSLPNNMLKLKYLNCSNNYLTDLPYLPELVDLECKNNYLKGYNLAYWQKIWKQRGNK